MARLRGWAAKGQRCHAAIPHGHWKTVTFVGGLTLAGFIAPMLLDGPMDGEVFRAWCEQMLAPLLRPHHIVIMDNLAAHKVDGVRQAIEACGATLLYLPPYSPDFNHRKCLRQTKGSCPQARRSNHRGPGNRRRSGSPRLQTIRMCQLLR